MAEKSIFTQRPDGRKFDELRPIRAEIGVVPNADGSALFAQGETIAIAAVYGPKTLHPKNQQNPEKGVLRVHYNMLPFSVPDRVKPGVSRRSQEISKVTEWALSPVVLLEELPGTVIDIHINIIQANAGTRCAGINAASMALAHAGVPMTELIAAVAIGKMDKTIIADVNKEEEDFEDGEGATDIPMAYLGTTGKISLLQLDGRIQASRFKEVLDSGRSACERIIDIQTKLLKEYK